MITPQKQFVANESRATHWRQLMTSDAFVAGVTFALAEFSLNRPTSEQMVGVSRFLSILTTLGDLPVPETETYKMPRLRPPEELVPETK